MNKIKNIIKGHKIITAILGIVVLFVIFKVIAGSGNSFDEFVVSKRDVIQKVTVTGKVKPKEEVSLSFEKTGKVSKVLVDVGSKVFAGQTLVSLDSGVEYADYLKAKANLETEKANLDKLKRGSGKEEIAIYETELENAKVSLLNAKDNVVVRLKDSYSKSDDAVRNNIDQFFSNSRSSNPEININISDIQLKNDINQSRFQIEQILLDWEKSDFSFSTENMNKSMENLNKVQNFIDKVSGAVNQMKANSSVSQTTVDLYKSSVSSARSNIVTAINNLWSAGDKYNTAKSAETLADKNLILEKRGATEDEIRAQEAKVMQYEALLQSSSVSLSKMTLSSPINGIITKQDAKLGEIVTSGSKLVSVISTGDFEIEANVSEVSIGKVSVSNNVEIVMDAFPGKIFKGKVSYIEPGETIVDGVVNFKVKIVFDEKYEEIKTGLTANLDIKTNMVSNVLSVPEYSIVRKDEKAFVRVKLGNKGFEEREIQTGLLGNDGFVEVLSGISEGDIVLIDSKK